MKILHIVLTLLVRGAGAAHAYSAKFPTLLSGCHKPHEQSLVCSIAIVRVAATKTLCLWRGRATACRTLEPQTGVCSPKLENNGFLRE